MVKCDICEVGTASLIRDGKMYCGACYKKIFYGYSKKFKKVKVKPRITRKILVNT